MSKSNHMVLVGVLASVALVGGLFVSPAMAFSGIYQGGAMEGNYFYNWTRSESHASGTYKRVCVWAKQDGDVNLSISGGPGRWRSVYNTGVEQNTNDGAGAYTVD